MRQVVQSVSVTMIFCTHVDKAVATTSSDSPSLTPEYKEKKHSDVKPKSTRAYKKEKYPNVKSKVGEYLRRVVAPKHPPINPKEVRRNLSHGCF
jgi:hypothetical protein